MDTIKQAAEEAIVGLMLTRSRAIQFVMKNESCTRTEAERAVNSVLGKRTEVLCED